MAAAVKLFPGPTYANTAPVAANTVDVEDEGVAVNTANTLNFTGSGVTVTDAGGGQADIDIPSGSTALPIFKALTEASSPYAQLAADEYLVVNIAGGNLVINLLGTGAASKLLRIKIIGIDPGVTTLTINRNGADTIDGAVSLTLNTLNQMVTLAPYSAGSQWLIS